MRHRRLVAAGWSLIAALALIAICGCGARRADGDPDGVPIAFTVRIEPAFVSSYQRGGDASVMMAHHHLGAFRRQVGPWGPDPWCDPWWMEPSYGATLTLLAGDGPSQGQLFRHALRFGDNGFSVPVRPGRVVTLTFLADGDYQGWETIGSFTAAAGARVAVVLGREGVHLETTTPCAPSEPTTTGDAAPAASTP